MIITNKIEIDLCRRGVEEIIDAVQGDENSREVAISLKHNGEDWTIPDGVTVTIGYKRKDGTGSTYDTMGDETLAYKYQGNVLTIALAPQVLIAPGRVGVTVCLIQDGVKLNTFSICVNVQPNNGLQNIGKDTYKLAGTVPDSGWSADKYLGTDEKGNVVEKDAPEGGSSGGAVTSIDYSGIYDGSFTETVDGEEVSHSVTFDESGRPATVDGVTLQWPEEEKEESNAGVTLPVVEVANVTAITEAESAAFTAAWETGIPCVVKISGGAVSVASVLIWTSAEGVRAYSMPDDTGFAYNPDTGLWEYSG